MKNKACITVCIHTYRLPIYTRRAILQPHDYVSLLLLLCAVVAVVVVGGGYFVLSVVVVLLLFVLFVCLFLLLLLLLLLLLGWWWWWWRSFYFDVVVAAAVVVMLYVLQRNHRFYPSNVSELLHFHGLPRSLRYNINISHSKCSRVLCVFPVAFSIYFDCFLLCLKVIIINAQVTNNLQL